MERIQMLVRWYLCNQ